MAIMGGFDRKANCLHSIFLPLPFLRMEKTDREKEPRLRTASHKKQKGKIEELFISPFLFPPFFPYRTNHDVGPFLLRHLLLIGFLPPSSGDK